MQYIKKSYKISLLIFLLIKNSKRCLYCESTFIHNCCICLSCLKAVLREYRLCEAFVEDNIHDGW